MAWTRNAEVPKRDAVAEEKQLACGRHPEHQVAASVGFNTVMLTALQCF